MRRMAGYVRAVLLPLMATPAMAHHSGAAFDFTKQVTVEGTIKSFDVTNPHTHALISLAGGPRGTRDVEFEGHSASNFYRAGFKRGSVTAGEHIRLVIAPRRDGADGGFITQFQDAHAHIVGFGNLSPSGGAKP